MKHDALRRAALATATAGLLLGAVATAAPASAAGNYGCTGWKQKVNTWSAVCTVRSGQARSVTECSNGKTVYGKWVGRGKWRFGGDCGRYFIVAQDTQGRG
ncbi:MULTISPECIES: hypothetical protein [Streptomyces]|uniref:hypothetical protein n=1 Tax=Streptomyces TaxID=1883 RepID=UPI001FEAC5AD|nr:MULTISPECIES: hypothetical protein [Streptomyces]